MNKRIEQRICRGCDKLENETKFSKTGKMCNTCRNKLKGNNWREAARKRNESSPDLFLKMLFHAVKARSDNCWHKNVEFNLTIEYLITLWEKQSGRCAISSVKLLHRRKSLFTVSVDRINSTLGYIEGNVQLTCKAMNLAKQHHTNSEMQELISAIRCLKQ